MLDDGSPRITTSGENGSGSECIHGGTPLLVYPASVFTAALVLLERAADSFVKNVASVSRYTSLSPSLIAIITAGAEWEELAVVLASLGNGASSLAVGNVVGSCISNILGAFSLGLVASPQVIHFDYSAKRFAIIQLAITTLVIALILLVQLQHTSRGKPARVSPSAQTITSPARAPASDHNVFENVVGVSLVIIFVLYILGLAWATGRGMLNPPENSASESSSSSESEDADDQSDAVSTRTFATESDVSSIPPAPKSRLRAAHRGSRAPGTSAMAESTPLLLGRATSNSLAVRINSRNRRSVRRAARKLVWSMIVLSLSGYLLSRSTLELADALRISDTVLGLTLLSFATTLPEKVLMLIAGSKAADQARALEQQRPNRTLPGNARERGSRRWVDNEPHLQEEGTAASGILMAGAAGSNVFLLTLCLGVSLIFDKGGDSLPAIPLQNVAMARPAFSASSIRWEELALLEISAASLVAVAYVGGRRWQGVVLLAAYLGFLVAEFTVLKR